MAAHPPIDSIEYYIRFVDRRTGAVGIIEAPFTTARQAAEHFFEDQDAVSAMKVGISPTGRPVAMSDATDEVRDALIQMVREELCETCPHPIIEEIFDDLKEDLVREQREDDEHVRIERAMLQI